MAVLGVGAVGMSNIAGAGAPKPAAQKFGEVMKTTRPPAQQKPATAAKPQGPQKLEGKVDATSQRPAARALDQVSAAQTRMEKVLELAQSGKSFTPAELLALQTQMYRASQELDLAGKVVEKATGGVKQVLQTQV
ncbi:MAG: ATP-dependent helicase HrpB [Myxococcaceae bacterium]|nr:ATP-dependent helicase HrpB [Myxococcaceae bacterium]